MMRQHALRIRVVLHRCGNACNSLGYETLVNAVNHKLRLIRCSSVWRMRVILCDIIQVNVATDTPNLSSFSPVCMQFPGEAQRYAHTSHFSNSPALDCLLLFRSRYTRVVHHAHDITTVVVHQCSNVCSSISGDMNEYCFMHT